MTLFERTSRRVALTPAGERLLADARAVLAAMERFAATAGELAAAPSTLALGYCHGSERAAMLAIGAFRASHPDAVVRADGLTSLRILDGVRAGTLAAGIVRGPVPRPRAGRLEAARPGARRPRRRAARTTRWPAPTSSTPATSMVSRCSSSTAPRRRRPTTRSRPTARRRERGRTGSPTPPCRSSGCSIRSPSAPASAGSTPGRPDRPAGRADIAVRPLRPVALFDTFHVVWRAGDDAATAQFVQALADACASLAGTSAS